MIPHTSKSEVKCTLYSRLYLFLFFDAPTPPFCPYPGTEARLRQRSTWMNLWARKPRPPPRRLRLRNGTEKRRRNFPGSIWTSWRSTKRPGREDRRGERRRACELCTPCLKICTAESENDSDKADTRTFVATRMTAEEFEFST